MSFLPTYSSNTFASTAGSAELRVSNIPHDEVAARPLAKPTKSRARWRKRYATTNNLSGDWIGFAEDIIRALKLNGWSNADLADEREEAQAVQAELAAIALRNQR